LLCAGGKGGIAAWRGGREGAEKHGGEAAFGGALPLQGEKRAEEKGHRPPSRKRGKRRFCHPSPREKKKKKEEKE